MAHPGGRTLTRAEGLDFLMRALWEGNDQLWTPDQEVNENAHLHVHLFGGTIVDHTVMMDDTFGVKYRFPDGSEALISRSGSMVFVV